MEWAKPSDDPNAMPWPTMKPQAVEYIMVTLPVTREGMLTKRRTVNAVHLITARAVEIFIHPFNMMSLPRPGAVAFMAPLVAPAAAEAPAVFIFGPGPILVLPPVTFTHSLDAFAMPDSVTTLSIVLGTGAVAR